MLFTLSSLCACVCKSMYTCAHKHGGQMTTCRLFFPFYPVGSGEGIQSSCLAAKGFPCRVISLAHSPYPETTEDNYTPLPVWGSREAWNRVLWRSFSRYHDFSQQKYDVHLTLQKPSLRHNLSINSIEWAPHSTARAAAAQCCRLVASKTEAPLSWVSSESLHSYFPALSWSAGV